MSSKTATAEKEKHRGDILALTRLYEIICTHLIVRSTCMALKLTARQTWKCKETHKYLVKIKSPLQGFIGKLIKNN